MQRNLSSINTTGTTPYYILTRLRQHMRNTRGIYFRIFAKETFAMEAGAMHPNTS
ncbi:MAG: hypothetical protein WEB30_12715 [Cyclobacteriaceae bacterium]